MSRPRTALVSGASIAGPAVAFWLERAGWDVTLVERAPERREEGQNIDVRGVARDVLRHMGLEDAALAANTGEVGTRFLRADGTPVASFPAGDEDHEDSATAEVEILRGELSRLVLDALTTEVRYGTHVTDIDDRDDGAHVTFDDGRRERYDLVVLAEGIRSRSRRFVTHPHEGNDGGDGGDVAELDMYCAYLTIPRAESDTGWWEWARVGRGRSVTLRPDNLGTTRATLSWITPTRGLAQLERDEQVRVLVDTFADAGWETPRVLRALPDSDFYFEALGQVRLDRWSRGRVVLVGDAAHAASPISGMGTSLALVGAYVLGGELAAQAGTASSGEGLDPAGLASALDRYEARMRPYVEKAQKLNPGAPRTGNPTTPAGLAVLHTVLRVAASRPARWLGPKLFSPPAYAFQLPEYPQLTAGPGRPSHRR